MESPARSKATLELGKLLVAQLNLGDDLLAQWMAHDIAARIAAVEHAGSDAPISLRDECAKSILALWAHRNELPPHLRAFRELEPLIRTIVALDVDNGDDYRFYRPVLRDAALDDVEGEAKKWLDLAFGLDYTARLIIQFALRSAGANAVLKAKPWIEAASSADLDPVTERLVVKFVSGDSQDASDGNAVLQKDLRDKIAKLESFTELASAIAAELRDRLEIGSKSNIEDDDSDTSIGQTMT